MSKVYHKSEKIKLKPNTRLMVDAYPKQLCVTPLSFFEVVCSQTGKNVMPPIQLDLCTSAAQFFKRIFDRLIPSILKVGILPQSDLSDSEIFEVCFAEKER